MNTAVYSDDILQPVLNGLGVGVWHLDVDSGRLDWTAPCVAESDTPLKPPASLDEFLAMLSGEDRESTQAALARTLDRGEPFNIEYRIVWPNGYQQWLEARGRLAGDRRSLTGLVADITRRKSTETALRESQAHLHVAVEAADIGVWDSDVVDGNTSVGWGPRCKRLFGFAPDEEVTPEMRLARIHRHDIDQFLAEAERAKDPKGNGEYDSEFRIVLPSGDIRWMISRGRCLFEGRGTTRHAVRFMGTAIDVTERHAAAVARRERQQHDHFVNRIGAALADSLDYRATLEKIANLCVPFMADWAFVDLLNDDNRFALAAVAHADPAQDDLAETIRAEPPSPNPLDHPRLKALFDGRPLLLADITDVLGAAARETEPPRRVQLMAQAIEGATASFLAVPLIAGGEPLGLLSLLCTRSGRQYDKADVAMAEDVGSRAALAINNARLYEAGEAARERLVEQARELREADRRKDEFLAMLAHELRNPLAPLSASLQTLRVTGGDNAPAKKAQAVMERQVNHLVRLIDDLLDVSRVTCGRVKLKKTRASLADIIAAAAEISRPGIEERGHDFSVTPLEDPAWLDADNERLTQVFVNLLNNASKYTPPGGRITLVAALTSRRGAKVVITDSGIGIPNDELDRVFELFVQGERRESAVGGLGIGLTLARQLVEMHDGTIEIKSPAADGAGSEFTVYLPLAPARAGEPSPPALAERTEQPGVRRRVLVIDDHADITDSMEMLLDLMGHDVCTAGDGEAGLAAGAEFKPDVVLLDIGLPGMSGHEVARRIRASDWGRAVKLVALTGWGQREDRRRSREAGFDLHLVKPVRSERLEKLLAEPAPVSESDSRSPEPAGRGKI